MEPIWNDWSSWTCNCEKETVRTRTCDGGKFGLTCLGDPIDKRKIRNKAQLDTCNPSDLENCDESDLNDFLNLEKELKARAQVEPLNLILLITRVVMDGIEPSKRNVYELDKCIPRRRYSNFTEHGLHSIYGRICK